MNGHEPNEHPSELASCERTFRDDDAIPANEGDATREVDADGRDRPAFGRQRFANHAA
jgi:hypothetical protein